MNPNGEGRNGNKRDRDKEDTAPPNSKRVRTESLPRHVNEDFSRRKTPKQQPQQNSNANTRKPGQTRRQSRFQSVVDLWEEQCRKNPATADMQHNFDSDLRRMRNLLLGHPPDTERFYLDSPDSDNEDMEDDTVKYNVSESGSAADTLLGLDLELFLANVTFKCVDPTMIADRGAANSDLLTNSGAWLRRFLERNRPEMLENVASTEDVVKYSTHLKCLIYLETHFDLLEAIAKCPAPLQVGTDSMASCITKYRNWIDQNQDKFVRLELAKVTPSMLLYNFKSVSTDAKLNKRLIEEFTGMSVCLGFMADGENLDFDGPPQITPLMLFAVRGLTYKNCEVDNLTKEKRVTQVVFRVCANRCLLRKFNPVEGDTLFLFPIHSIITQHRMFKAVHNIVHSNPRVLNHLFGQGIPQRDGKLLKKGKRRQTKVTAPLEPMMAQLDPGCAHALAAIPDSECNASQRRAVITCLLEMGSLGPGTGSMSAIFGPPGTGKTKCIGVLIYALCSHSMYGHLNGTTKRLLSEKTGTTIAHTDSRRLRILVCCSSNMAVDRIAETLNKGVRRENGTVFVPEMVRVVRTKYKFANDELKPLELNTKALELDRKIFHPEDEDRKFASQKAIKFVGRECIVFLVTCSSAANGMMKKFKVPFDVVILDEGSHTFEPEALIPVALSGRISTRHYGRLHVVKSGDKEQLSAVLKCEYPVRSMLKSDPTLRSHIHFKRLIRSMFDRLITGRRIAFTRLHKQYRMHPDIGMVQMPPTYRDITHPGQVALYEKKFNQPDEYTDALAPFTIVDTSLFLSRVENNKGSGKFSNKLEARLVDYVLRRLYKFMPDSPPGGLIITSPYKSQQSYLELFLKTQGMLSDISLVDSMGIEFSSTDVLQGSERPCMILSMARSNERNDIGFLCDRRRLNVATSRAKYLLVIIADSSTLCERSDLFKSFWEDCLHGRFGAKLMLPKPEDTDLDPVQASRFGDLRRSNECRGVIDFDP